MPSINEYFIKIKKIIIYKEELISNFITIKQYFAKNAGNFILTIKNNDILLKKVAYRKPPVLEVFTVFFFPAKCLH